MTLNKIYFFISFNLLGKCTKKECPMQAGVISDDCDLKDCPYRTETEYDMEFSKEQLTTLTKSGFTNKQANAVLLVTMKIANAEYELKTK